MLAAAAQAGLSTVLDLPLIKTQVQHKLSRALNGRMTWGALRIRLLPMPHVDMREVAIEIPDQVRARSERVEVGLRLVPLLLGQVEITSVAAVGPVIRLDIAPSAAGERGGSIDPVTVYRSVVGPVAWAIRNAAPGAVLEITGADVELHAPGTPDLHVRGMSLKARADARGMDLEARAASNFWERLRFLGRVESADLSGHFSLEVTDLNPQAWLDRALAGAMVSLDIPRAALRAQLSTDGATDLRCSLALDIASLQVGRAGPRLRLTESGLKAAAVLGAGGSQITLSELRAGSLLAAGRGTLRMNNGGGMPQATLEIPEVDLGALRDAAMLLAADSAAVRRYARGIIAGDIANLRLRAEAATWPELLLPGHLAGSATVAHASVDLPALEVRATELAGRIELSAAAVDVSAVSAQLGSSHVTDGKASYSLRKGAASASFGVDLDVPQSLAMARHALTRERAGVLNDIAASSGRLLGRVNLASMGEDWKTTIEITRSNASVELTPLPWPVVLQAVQVSVSAGRVAVSGLRGTIGQSDFEDVGATFALGSEPRVTGGSGRATLALGQIYPWVRSRGEVGERMRDVGSVAGRVQITVSSLAGALDRPLELAYDAMVRPDQLSVETRELPGPLTIAGGSVHIDQRAVKVDQVRVAMLDASVLVSGEIADYRGEAPKANASISGAMQGSVSAHWIWQRLGAPSQFEPRTPLRFDVERVTWSPGQAVDAKGRVKFDAGPDVTVDIGWAPGALDVRRLAIQDRDRLAVFALRVKDSLLEATFAGSIFARSIAAMFYNAGEYQGRAAGDLRIAVDLERRGRSSAQGNITAENLDLDELLPVQSRAQGRIERLDLSASGSSLQIRKAIVHWAQQTATLSGEVSREGDGLIVDLQLDSEGIDADALRHRGVGTDLEAGGALEKSNDGQGARILSRLWSIPITGQVTARAGFVRLEGLRLMPVTAILTLGEQRADLRLQDTKLCGLSVPLTVQVVPAGFTAAAQIQAQKLRVEDVAGCLADERLLLTGEFDGRVNLAMKGDLNHGLKNLEGTVHLECRNGHIQRFALIGNILATTDLLGLFDRKLSLPGAEGFPYRTLTVEGKFNQGQFILEDLVLDSSAFGLAAVGSVRLADRDTHLTALVAPFNRLDNLVREVPVIGHLVGGTLTSIPVDVRGDIRDPTVIPLDPRAIASGLRALFERALKIPERTLTPLRSSPEAAVPSGGR